MPQSMESLDDSRVDRSFHFMNDDDVVVRVSQAVFDDFHRFITSNSSFNEIVQNLYETCDDAVKSIRTLSAGVRRGSTALQPILNQLCNESGTYLLLLNMCNAELAAQNAKPPRSRLERMVQSNPRFRKLQALLKWAQAREISTYQGFLAPLTDDSINVERICTQLCSWMRNHDMDLLLVQKNQLRPHYEESVTHFIQLIMAYVRSGRNDDAIELAKQTGCFTLAAFVESRRALFEPALSPLDEGDDNYGFCASRLTFKHVARSMYKAGSESQIGQLQHALCATLAGSLPPLLTYSTCADDRLWAYINCAAEALFDESVDADVDSRYVAIDEEVPKDVSAIFAELYNSNSDKIYHIYGALATERVDEVNRILAAEMAADEPLQAHVARFYAHLILVLKLMGKTLEQRVVDGVICQFIDVLIRLNQHALAPFYLYHASADVSREKFVELLRGIENETQRREVLLRADECGFEPNDLCIAVYESAKSGCNFDAGEDKISRMFTEIMRGWRWLTYSGTATAARALNEAIFIIRKLLSRGRTAEIVELMATSDSVLAETERLLAQRDVLTADDAEALHKARREYRGYMDYFEATEAYNSLVAHVEKPLPELPTKLSDDNWARLDMRRRAEYEMLLEEAHESRQRYESVSASLRKHAVACLENILKSAADWLPPVVDAKASKAAKANELHAVRNVYAWAVVQALIDVHKRVNDHDRVLNVAQLIVDPKYNVSKLFTKAKLRKILQRIAKSGAAIINSPP